LLIAVFASRLGAADLTIVVANVRDSRGVVGVLIFDSPRGWPEDPKGAVQAKAVPAHPGVVTLSFENLTPGEYAAVVLHDVNQNQKVEKNWLGMPKEGWGMSNNPKPRRSAPPFDAAKFQLTGNQKLLVHLRY
jgi:uncharacterized protein (DUF2141 family)